MLFRSLHYMTSTGISGVEQHLSGYYAVAMLNDKKELTIFRDSIAKLFCASIDQLNGQFIFATTKTLIIDICARMGWTHSQISALNNNTLLKFKKGELIETSTICPMGYSKKESKFASKSLGFEVENDISSNNVVKLRSEYSQYSDDEEQFLMEVEQYSDHTYTFFDYRNDKLTHKEFMALSSNEKLYCLVVLRKII